MVSRGGARLWYQHLTNEYVDIFDCSPSTSTARATRSAGRSGHQKQFDVTRMEREIVERAKKQLGLEEVELLHPSVMYKLLRFFWFEKASVRLLTEHADYRRLTPEPRLSVMAGLPNQYVAVRFYFRPSFPDTPENRRFAPTSSAPSAVRFRWSC